MNIFEKFRRNSGPSKENCFLNASFFYTDFLDFISSSDIFTKVQPSHSQLRGLEILMGELETEKKDEQKLETAKGMITYANIHLATPYVAMGIIAWNISVNYPSSAMTSIIDSDNFRNQDNLLFSIFPYKIQDESQTRNLVSKGRIFPDGRIVGERDGEILSYHYLGEFETKFGFHNVYCNKILRDNFDEDIQDLSLNPSFSR